MTTLEDYVRQSRYTDPGPYASLLDDLPTDVRELAAVVRNVVVHYRASGIAFTGDRLAEIDSRWLERLLATDQRRNAAPLADPRAASDRVVGCCRDFTLLTVAALRHRGIPARSRVGFAGYFSPDFHTDHVIAEYWNGARWVFVDSELDPAETLPFDPADLPREGATPEGRRPFRTAARAWTAFRNGDIDADRYGVAPDLPLHGGWFVRDYVLHELAHRQREELLLWDRWGAMAPDLDGDLGLVDEVAALLLAADEGDATAERELAGRYARDPALHPDGRVYCMSPSGTHTWVDLSAREALAP